VKTIDRSILKRNKPSPVAVPIPEWGEDAGVYVKVMNAMERTRYEEVMKNVPEGLTRRALFVQLVACDENGKTLFTLDDMEALNQEDFRALDRIIAKGLEVNALGDEQEAALKKSLETPGSTGGSSDSAPTAALNTPTS
jgi:hypothetical protein